MSLLCGTYKNSVLNNNTATTCPGAMAEIAKPVDTVVLCIVVTDIKALPLVFFFFVFTVVQTRIFACIRLFFFFVTCTTARGNNPPVCMDASATAAF